jgi:uncharacterized protein YjiS (DUF1127 family)
MQCIHESDIPVAISILSAWTHRRRSVEALEAITDHNQLADKEVLETIQ